jgi:hypothetical protein
VPSAGIAPTPDEMIGLSLGRPQRLNMALEKGDCGRAPNVNSSGVAGAGRWDFRRSSATEKLATRVLLIWPTSAPSLRNSQRSPSGILGRRGRRPILLCVEAHPWESGTRGHLLSSVKAGRG